MRADTPTPTHAITIAIPTDTFDKLSCHCKEKDRSRSYIVRKAIEMYLEISNEK